MLRRVPLSIALFNRDGELLSSNETFDVKFGIKHPKMLNLNQLLQNEKGRLNIIKGLLQEGIEIHSFELDFKDYKGKKIWFNVSVFLDQSYGATSDNIVFVANDITQSKQAVERINKKEFLLNIFNENLSEGLFREQQGAGITYVNTSFLKLFNLDSTDNIPQLSLFDFIADSEEILYLKDQLNQSGFIRNKKVLFKIKEKSPFWGMINITLNCDVDGGEFYYGTVIDISDQKQKDDLIKKQNDELDYANDQIERLLYSSSHDLKSPLSSMEGLLNLMDLEFNNSGELNEYIKMLRECSKKLNQVVDGISDYTSSTRKRLSTSPILIGELLKRIVQTATWKNEIEDVDISIKHESSVPFYTDVERLSTIVDMVFSNAIQFRDFNKKQSFVRINSRQTAEKLIIEIIDNGQGIPNECLDKVFNMYYKASNDSYGVGLGLYIAKETVRKLKGDINIDSSFGQGTIVNIEIPNGAKGKLRAKKHLLENHLDQSEIDFNSKTQKNVK